MKGLLVEVRRTLLSECGGTWAVWITVEAELPPDDVAIVATRGTPPASWSRSLPVKGLKDAEAALQKMTFPAPAEAAESVKLVAAGADGALLATVAYVSQIGEIPDYRYRVLRYVWRGGRFVMQGDDTEHRTTMPPVTLSRRDIDGDGRIDCFMSSHVCRGFRPSGSKSRNGRPTA